MGVQDGPLDQKMMSVVKGLGFKLFIVDPSRLLNVVKDMNRSTSTVPFGGRVRSYISQSGILDDILMFTNTVCSEYIEYGLIFYVSAVICKLRYIPYHTLGLRLMNLVLANQNNTIKAEVTRKIAVEVKQLQAKEKQRASEENMLHVREILISEPPMSDFALLGVEVISNPNFDQRVQNQVQYDQRIINYFVGTAGVETTTYVLDIGKGKIDVMFNLLMDFGVCLDVGSRTAINWAGKASSYLNTTPPEGDVEFTSGETCVDLTYLRGQISADFEFLAHGFLPSWKQITPGEFTVQTRDFGRLMKMTRLIKSTMKFTTK